MITKTKLNLRVKENLKFAKEFYESSKDDSGLPTILAVDTSHKNKKKGLTAILDGSALERRREIALELGLMAGIQLFKKEIDSIEAVYMVSEAWFSSDISKNKDSFVMPSKDPNRKEAIVSSGLSENGTTAFGIFELKRSVDFSNNTVKVSFHPLEDMKPGKKKGDDVQIASPLLENFWKGVKLVGMFSEDGPESAKKELEDLSTKEIFAIFSRAFNKIINRAQ